MAQSLQCVLTWYLVYLVKKKKTEKSFEAFQFLLVIISVQFLSRKTAAIKYGWDCTLLEKCWRIFLPVTDDAIALSDVKFSQIEGNGRKFSHRERSNSVSC